LTWRHFATNVVAATGALVARRNVPGWYTFQ
jgi:hypothetical protein